MSNDDLPGAVCTAVMRVGSKTVGGFDAVFRRLDLTQAQFRTLLSVWQAGNEGIASSVLADQLLIDRATITPLTTKLVDRGLIERVPGENRRTFQLRMTAEGLALIDRALPHAVALADETLTEFSTDELAQLLGLLDRLENSLRRHDPEAFWKRRLANERQIP